MEKSANKTMSCAAFARRHDVSKTTVRRWKEAGYLVMTADKVDVARSEKLLRGRSAESRGGMCKGPTAEDGGDFDLAGWIADLEKLKAASELHVAAIYQAIIADMRKLPAIAGERDILKGHYRHQDALRRAKGIA